MVRTPLEMRISSKERLNAVDCLLPFFDAQSVKDVAKALMSGGDGGEELPGRRVLFNPDKMEPSPVIPQAVPADRTSVRRIPLTTPEYAAACKARSSGANHKNAYRSPIAGRAFPMPPGADATRQELFAITDTPLPAPP